MKRFRLDRRSFLRGSSAAVALPVLHCMLGNHGKAFATDGTSLPRRFGMFSSETVCHRHLGAHRHGGGLVAFAYPEFFNRVKSI